MSAVFEFWAACPRGTESLVADELRALSCKRVRPLGGGVSFGGPLWSAYRALLWSRVASRILLTLERVPAATADELYDAVAAIPWEEHLGPDGTLAVDASGVNAGLRNTQFTAVRVKDAIADRFTQQVRPPAERRHLRPGPAHQRGRPKRARHDLDRPVRPAPAPARLPRTRRPGRGAHEGDARGRAADGRRLARDRRGRGRLRRPDVRLGDASDRGRPDRRRRRPGTDARELGLLALARPRRRGMERAPRRGGLAARGRAQSGFPPSRVSTPTREPWRSRGPVSRAPASTASSRSPSVSSPS